MNVSPEIDDALVKACLKGSPQALALYYKVTGQTEDKPLVIERVISADEQIKIMNKANEKIEGKALSNKVIKQIDTPSCDIGDFSEDADL